MSYILEISTSTPHPHRHPIFWLLLPHSPSCWAPPISCGRPCSTPGPLFLQLFSLFLNAFFLRLKFTAPPTPSAPTSTPPPPQTNAAGVQFVVTAGRPVRTAGLHRDNSGLYAFMKLSHTLKGPPILLSCFKGWLLMCASDFIWSALWSMWLSTFEAFVRIKKSSLLLLLRFY